MTVQEATKKMRAELLKIGNANEAMILTDMLLCAVLSCDKTTLRLDPSRMLSPEQESSYMHGLAELLSHKPIQYVLGFADFYGLQFKVDSSVLIPRPETEELIEKALKSIGDKRLRVLEIGTGSGCIAIALKKNAPQIEIVSLDISEKAVELARENALRLEVEVDFKQIDFLNCEKWSDLGAFDLIISNPPYILDEESAQMEKNVLKYEPHLALFVTNKDCLQFYKAIAQFTKVTSSGTKAIFLELNQRFANETKRLFCENDWDAIIEEDINSNPRILICLR